MTPQSYMPARARIAALLASRISDNVADALGAARYTVVEPDEFERADLGLVDLRGRTLSASRLRALDDALQSRAADAGLLFLVDPPMAREAADALGRRGEIVPTTDRYDYVVARIRETLRIRRLAEEAGERLHTLGKLDRLDRLPAITGASKNVLIIGPPGAAAARVFAVARAAGWTVTGAQTAGQAARAILSRPFDLYLFLPPADDHAFAALGVNLRRRWARAGAPSIMIADEAAASIEASDAVDLLSTDDIEKRLPHKMKTALRRERLRAVLPSLLTPHGAGAAPDFFTEHAARACARAEDAGRPISFLIIRVDSGPANGASGRARIHSILTRILRREDVTAMLSRGVIAALLPATTGDDATRIARRVEAVLGKNAAPARLEVAAAERPPGAQLEEAIAATFRALPDQGAIITPRRRFPQ